MPRSTPLTRERILTAALALADAHGVDGLSMRNLARELGVGAMSLYNHVEGKDDVIDGITDLVAAEFTLPAGEDWRGSLRASALAAHHVLLRHPWACVQMMARPQLGPARLAYYDAILGTLFAAGFDGRLARRGFLTLDAHVLGFTLQEASNPYQPEEFSEALDVFIDLMPPGYPHMRRMLTELGASGDWDYGFSFTLDLILDGLARSLDGAS